MVIGWLMAVCGCLWLVVGWLLVDGWLLAGYWLVIGWLWLFIAG